MIERRSNLPFVEKEKAYHRKRRKRKRKPTIIGKGGGGREEKGEGGREGGEEERGRERGAEREGRERGAEGEGKGGGEGGGEGIEKDRTSSHPPKIKSSFPPVLFLLLFLSFFLSPVSPLATRPSSSISTHKNATTVTTSPTYSLMDGTRAYTKIDDSHS